MVYYVETPYPTMRDLDILENLSNKAMEVVRKKHMTKFHNWLPRCDRALGFEFL
jgi:hypothetical protein